MAGAVPDRVAIMRAARFLQPVNRGDVGMIQRSQHLRFALEAGEPLRIMRKRFGHDFDGHGAPELRVMRLIDLSHPARTNGADDVVRAEFGPSVQQEIPRVARDFGWRLSRRQNASPSCEPSRVPTVSITFSLRELSASTLQTRTAPARFASEAKMRPIRLV